MRQVEIAPELKVQKLDRNAIVPVCAHPGEDLGFDLFALEGTLLLSSVVRLVRTGIAAEMAGHGFLILGRSSLAKAGVTVSGGVIDMGYRGELFVNLTFHSNNHSVYHVVPGDKIAQLVPVKPITAGPVNVHRSLSQGSRGAEGYGSTGR